MEYKGLKPNAITYTAAISACGNGGQWEESVKLLEQMSDRSGVCPNIFHISAVIAACEKAGVCVCVCVMCFKT
jgi:pentatricopeptide repeat domain-containing protein 1